MEKHLGKIASVRLGKGGYQDAMFGFTFQLRFDKNSGIGDFWGFWNSEPDNYAKWSNEERLAHQSKCFERFRILMNEANANDIRELEGKPIEVTIDDMRLHSWRILEEVL